MFSGIIEKKSQILKIEGSRFTVKNPFWNAVEVGQSIAHDGACMTLEEITTDSYTFFAMEETFLKTNFHNKQERDYFNIERSLQVGERIDGHFVSGHIDTSGEITTLQEQDDGSLLLWVSFAKKFSKYTIEKGSIALNGVSLTIIEKREWYISVSLIPLTQDWTNLWTLKMWNIINIEFDLLWKYIINS